LNKFGEETEGVDSCQIARDKFLQSKTSDKYDQALFFDLTSWLPDSQLTKVDIASMTVSLEARSPFLDQKVIEMAWFLRSEGSWKGYKYILKKAIEKSFPRKTFTDKKWDLQFPLTDGLLEN
jgi:asparagine synthase (glutamine-hydrolysing)